jgi:hypothetical protein
VKPLRGKKETKRRNALVCHNELLFCLSFLLFSFAFKRKREYSIVYGKLPGQAPWHSLSVMISQDHDPSSSSETAAEMNGSAELNCRARQLGTGGLKAATAMMGGSLFLCGGKGKRKSRGNNCFALWALIAGAKGACCCVCVRASCFVARVACALQSAEAAEHSLASCSDSGIQRSAVAFLVGWPRPGPTPTRLCF